MRWITYLIYLVTVVGFGLLQIWVVAGFFTMKEVPWTMKGLLQDGGLFFFSSSLAITTFLNHRRIFIRVGEVESFWSYFFTTIILVLCIMGYISAIDTAKSLPEMAVSISLNSTQFVAQMISVVLAVTYGLIIEIRVNNVLNT